MSAGTSRKQKQPPQAVARYMKEYDEAEESVREYILRQLQYFGEIEDRARATVEQWMGFKLGCSALAAKTAIRWAQTKRDRDLH